MSNAATALPQGKDAPFDETITTLRARLLDLGVEVDERAWLNPVKGVWSVNLALSGCSGLFTNGKGTSRDAALASAYGEFFERLTTGYLISDLFLPLKDPEKSHAYSPDEVWLKDIEAAREMALKPELWDLYDPEAELTFEHLVDFNTGGEHGIVCLPFLDAGGQRVLFPVSILENLYVSNGMASGNTPLEAKVQALSEVVERYVKERIITRGFCLPDLPLEVLDRFPLVVEGMKALEARGLRIRVKDASLGGRFPVVCVVAINPEDGGVFASFGAHPSFAVAFSRTFTELLQGRDEIKGFPFPTMDDVLVASSGNVEDHFVDSSGLLHWNFLGDKPDFPFVRWGEEPMDRNAEYAQLLSVMKDEGKDLYVWEGDHLGMPCCRVVVPGLSEIYPVEELVWESRGRQVMLRRGLLGLDTLKKSEAEALFELIEDGAFSPETPVCDVVGVAGENPWKDICVAEVAAWFAVVAEEEYEAARWFGVAGRLDIPNHRKLFHLAMEAALMAKGEGREMPPLEALLPLKVHRMVKASLFEGKALFLPEAPFLSLVERGEHGRIAERVAHLRKTGVSR